mgnify:CR=1 FL=1
MRAIAGIGSWGILGVMVLFWLGTTAAQSLAFNRASRVAQYAGLGIYVLLQALIFVPLIYYTAIVTKGNPGEILIPACMATGALVIALTAGEIADKKLEEYELPEMDPALREELEAFVARRRTELGD